MEGANSDLDEPLKQMPVHTITSSSDVTIAISSRLAGRTAEGGERRKGRGGEGHVVKRKMW